MSVRFRKTIKNARRGIALSKRFRHRLAGSAVLFVLLLLAASLLVWWQEDELRGSFWNSVWSVLFTLIGQGEFASHPHTFVGRVVVFLLSVFGVALFGVVFAELMQRVIDERVKELFGMNACKYQKHTIICGWNTRGPHLVRQLMASGSRLAVIAEERPAGLPRDVFFVRGNPSDQEALLKAGAPRAAAAVILWDPKFGDDDSRAILTGLAVENAAPNIYSVMELHNPDNERYARCAHVDDILYADSLIADITGICTHFKGISSFVKDILSTSDDGHSFASYDVPQEYEGRTVGTLFEAFRARGVLPVGIIVPLDGGGAVPVSQWSSRIDPSYGDIVELPMKVVCIRKNNQ